LGVILRINMKICKYRTTLSIIFGFLAIVVLGFISWSYMWQDEFLGKWASVVTILSLVGIPIFYFLNQDKKETEKEQKESGKRNQASKINKKVAVISNYSSIL